MAGKKKLISILLPTYNEEENVELMYQSLIDLYNAQLKSKYNIEIIFIDNYSTDKTREKIEKLCNKDKRVKAIFNAKNFGQIRSPFYGLLQTNGDCAVIMPADFQDPPEKIIDFVKEWENGYKIVIGKKIKSKENFLMYFIRSVYYNLIKRISETEQIKHFTGFGLYDKKFINVLRKLEDPFPYLRGIVAELGFKRKEIEYVQQKRRAGKTKNNWFSLYDVAMLGITSYSKIVLRLATFIGFIIAGISLLIALYYLIMKLIYWDRYPLGTAPILISIYFLGAVQLFFIGLLGEYILSINIRIMKRPLVIEERRINF
jgi:glycosyltransferase involved in cell wall biosynthesis